MGTGMKNTFSRERQCERRCGNGNTENHSRTPLHTYVIASAHCLSSGMYDVISKSNSDSVNQYDVVYLCEQGQVLA